MEESEKKRVLIVDNDEEESRKLEGMLRRRAMIRVPRGVGSKHLNSCSLEGTTYSW